MNMAELSIINRLDQLLAEQRETNRLLRALAGEQPPEPPPIAAFPAKRRLGRKITG